MYTSIVQDGLHGIAEVYRGHKRRGTQWMGGWTDGGAQEIINGSGMEHTGGIVDSLEVWAVCMERQVRSARRELPGVGEKCREGGRRE
jgi:hypothetical protein